MSEATWPPTTGLRTVNVTRQDTILPSYHSIRINAPAASVFEVLREVGEYGQWNQWVPDVEVHSQPEECRVSKRLELGTFFTFNVIMDGNKPSSKTPTSLRITDVSTPDHPSSYVPESILKDDGSFTADVSTVYRIAWKAEGGFANRGLRTERFHEVIVLGERECEVRTWECQGGMLAHAVKWMYKQTLMDKFKLWCEDLKRYCEKEADQ